ncbi:MAG: glycoside hydrolase family 2 TIM barrel-domain containing protein [Candidatus Hinthialibacter antarcticus]|nr:glycoside hydrolase family 2 TIM barrel-domain containing protein [Candidatus Hinthialibacter antarcticus]
MKRFITSLLILCTVSLAYASNEIDLAGRWRFQLDPENIGTSSQNWQLQTLTQSVRLPGSLQEQGYGEAPRKDSNWTTGIGLKLLDDSRFAEYVEADEFQSPFWLTPERLYVGAAWYQRDIQTPKNWDGKRIVLFLERPHWQTSVWIDGKGAGSQDSLGVPHEYDITEFIIPGKKQQLTIRVDNGYVVPVGKDAHSISDQTQSNWNGLAGAIKLIAGPRIWFDDVQIYPDLDRNQIDVQIKLGNATGQSGQGELSLSTKNATARSHPVKWNAENGAVNLTYNMGDDWQAWSEYSPVLNTLHLSLKQNGAALAQRDVQFGMRELGIKGKQFTINGTPIFIRGTLECAIFPEHGYPPTEVKEWKRLIGIAKSHGLNHFRFHSWCPPQAAFQAADEEGFYIQAEGSCWASFGDGTELDEWIYLECDRMLKTYGNHPSFLFMSPSNEPGGKNRDAFLGKLVNYLKQKDPRRYFAAGAGWPNIPENQYSIQYATRLQNWKTLKFDQPPQTWDDYRDYVNDLPIPTIGHEIGQWCVYPDLSEAGQYKGVLKAKNIEVFRDKLQKAGMLHLADDFLMASGKFHTLLYKQEIEAALRTPGYAGFQLLDLHDFPGQGTAPVGVLNALWNEKGYVSGDEYSRFCNDVVPLARMKKRIFTNDEYFNAAIDAANYRDSDLSDINVHYELVSESGQSIFDGERLAPQISAGGLTRLAEIACPLDQIHQAEKLTLTISFEGTPYKNSWEIWVYPKDVAVDPKGVVLTQDWREALAELQSGGNVVLVPKSDEVASNTLGRFRPIFWNRITFPQQKEHTVGSLIRNHHPALEGFPTDAYNNWQWQDLLDSSKPIILDSLPEPYFPIMQPIDDWNDCQKLGVLFEAKVAKGNLLVCSMDVVNDLESRVVARQLRSSLLHYAAGKKFSPEFELAEETVRSLFQ